MHRARRRVLKSTALWQTNKPFHYNTGRKVITLVPYINLLHSYKKGKLRDLYQDCLGLYKHAPPSVKFFAPF